MSVRVIGTRRALASLSEIQRRETEVGREQSRPERGRRTAGLEPNRPAPGADLPDMSVRVRVDGVSLVGGAGGTPGVQ